MDRSYKHKTLQGCVVSMSHHSHSVPNSETLMEVKSKNLSRRDKILEALLFRRSNIKSMLFGQGNNLKVQLTTLVFNQQGAPNWEERGKSEYSTWTSEILVRSKVSFQLMSDVAASVNCRWKYNLITKVASKHDSHGNTVMPGNQTSLP